MKLSETQISETFELDDPLLYDTSAIVDNGYGKYTHKVIITHISTGNSFNALRIFRILFNIDTMSRKLHNAFMQAGIDLYDEKLDNGICISHNAFETITCVYYDSDIHVNNQEKYNGIKEYVNGISKRSIKTIYSIQINKGEYSAEKGLYQVNI